MIQRTLVLIKPEGVKNALVGKILTRFEDAGLKIVGVKMLWADEEKAGQHYTQDIADKHGERVRNSLLEYIQEGPIIAMVIEGVEAIATVRKIVGPTYPNEAAPGTIRGDFCHVSRDYANKKKIPVRNMIHASANEKDAKNEIPIWFSESDLHTYKTSHDMINLS